MPDRMVKDGHLGGFVKGGDDRTYYPDLWRWLVTDLEIDSVVDVGCGEGHALDFFKQQGVQTLLGIDGSKRVLDDPVATVKDNIVIHDYTKGPYVPDRMYTLAWCCEFVEHVEERYIDNFIATFRQAYFVAMTHAKPGQGGYHHVNENTDEYWIKKMDDAGFLHVPGRSEIYRSMAHGYFKESGLFFVNPYV